MKRIEIATIFIFSLVFCLPIFFKISQTFPRLDSDYNAVLGIYEYIGQYVRAHFVIPSIIPFVTTGIPVIGDPLNAILDPFFSIPIILFGVNAGLRLTILINALLSGIGMFVFLKSLRTSKFMQFAGSLLYLSSGPFIASVSAGHITEKFLAYPLIPIFFMLAIKEKLGSKSSIGLSILLGAAIYFGDFYMVWFLVLFLLVIRGYYVCIQKKFLEEVVNVVSIFIYSLAFVSPKLYFFVRDVLPIMQRTNIVNPFLGSIHFFLFPLQFLVPFQVNFYDRPFFQRHLGFYYNWYEYYAFIGLLPVVFLKNIKGIFKDKYVKIFAILLFVGALYLANGYWYSPFHYLFLLVKQVDVFRVPQRVVIPLTSITIALLCLCADTWRNKRFVYGIFTISIFWTFSIGWLAFFRTFVPISQDEIIFTNIVERINSKHAAVLIVDAGSEYLLSKKGIPVINYYYGWVPRNTPIIFTKEGQLQKDVIAKTEAKYILSTKNYTFDDLGYQEIGGNKNEIVWAKL